MLSKPLGKKRRWVGPSQDKSVPVAVRIAWENAKLRSTAANAMAQVFIKVLQAQQPVEREEGTEDEP